ncbi:MAG: PfkB family carbohydrate kinase [Breoghania sp.]|nr:PfkB family carbohydrate kinase [Breoghania sp.]
MFLVCGEALWDLFVSDYGADADVGGMARIGFDGRIGGSPFNVAIGISRLGHRSGFFSGISSDPLGRRLIHALERENVDTAHVISFPNPTTLSLVDVGPDGGPAYTFYGTGAADRALNSGDLPDLAEDVWGIHFGSYSLVVEPVGSALLELAEREAGRRLITLDPNVRFTVESDRDVWCRCIEAFVSHSDVVKVREEDLEFLYPGECFVAVAARWRATGAGIVVVTGGRAGVCVPMAAVSRSRWRRGRSRLLTLSARATVFRQH